MSGAEITIGRAALEAFGRELGGRLIVPESEDYDDARRVWNGMVDKRPAAIVRCRGLADVVQSIRFARENDLLLAVRGGGHNVAGFATCDGGLVLDLTGQRGIHVDPRARTARVQAGVVWGELDRETQAFGLAVPGGVVSTTGVAGLTLGGGQGWLRRTCGMTCDSLLSVDIVTAAGDLITASEAEHADLFWAVRGGGGNFGIVTEFEFRVHPAGPVVAFAAPVYPMARASEVVEVPEAFHGHAVVILNALSLGNVDRGTERLEPLRTLGKPLFDMSGAIPYASLQQLFDPFFPARELRYYWKSLYLRRPESDAISTLATAAARRPSSMSMLVLWALGGAMSRVGADETAVGSRESPFLLEILANWRDAADTASNVGWARKVFDEMSRFSTGKPNFNFPGAGENMSDFVQAAFGLGYPRLRAVKQKYDPSNVFRLNQNIT